MYQIKIRWDSVIPLFKSVSGIVEIHKCEFDFNPLRERIEFLTRFRVSCRPGILSYSEAEEGEGIPNDLFESLKPKIETAVRAYQQGVGLEEDMFLWQTPEDFKEYEKASKFLFPEGLDDD